MKKKVKIAIISKLMPLYRFSIFQKLSSYNDGFEFTIFGDIKEQGGIETIGFEYSDMSRSDGLRWIKTKNYFYKPELLLWQTGVVRRIIFSDFKVFIFEGAVSHYPIWIYAVLCRVMRKKVLFWTHGFKKLEKGLRKQIRKFFFKYLSDALLLYGHHQKEIMIRDGFSPEKLFVIYNSLDADKQFRILAKIDKRQVSLEKESIFKNKDAFTIIFIGRLVTGKKVMEIIRASHSLIRYNIAVNCILIGDGPEKINITNYCRVNNLSDHVYLAGSLYNEEEIAKYFCMANLLVSPGNVGLNCIHSLAYGVPVMTHDNFAYQNPEVEAIFDGETGVFFKYNDFEDMISKLKFWIKNKKNNDELFEKCQSVIKKTYNANNQSMAIINAVEQIL